MYSCNLRERICSVLLMVYDSCQHPWLMWSLNRNLTIITTQSSPNKYNNCLFIGRCIVLFIQHIFTIDWRCRNPIICCLRAGIHGKPVGQLEDLRTRETNEQILLTSEDLVFRNTQDKGNRCLSSVKQRMNLTFFKPSIECLMSNYIQPSLLEIIHQLDLSAPIQELISSRSTITGTSEIKFNQ